ncbi:uncharacterized protein LOC121247497 [Juglans microcarpa x Juglans regia]|uniref:uncharacterized protein LOC121247497 n=1 Tax=Juglans microcarpa x Juglans regia TaxID=2249226 RepID=UPI001B7F0CD4|nr:uncharacterized protein LOC121247497 [Juglans microcarpa x Juglans regia]
MEKAFEHVNWDFLLYMPGKHGFGKRWCQWIKHCITIVRFSILLNGTPEGFFNNSRDPDQIRSLRALLCFEVVSNLTVNLSKSEIVPVGLVNNLREVAAILGCKFGLDWLANGLLKAFIGELKCLELQVDDRFLVPLIAEKNKRALSQISLGGKSVERLSNGRYGGIALN